MQQLKVNTTIHHPQLPKIDVCVADVLVGVQIAGIIRRVEADRADIVAGDGVVYRGRLRA